MTPLVRVVVLNYNGGELSASLRREPPGARLAARAAPGGRRRQRLERREPRRRYARRFPEIDVVESAKNLGFARGNNLALRDLDGVDYVALLNNDAWVEPGWLAPLVEALESDSGLGAACPKILFAPRFVELELEGPAFRPGGADPRELAARLSGVEIDGADRFARLALRPRLVRARSGVGSRAELPLDGADSTPATPVRHSGAHSPRGRAGEAGHGTLGRRPPPSSRSGPEPAWYDVACGGPTFDIVNNVGSEMIVGRLRRRPGLRGGRPGPVRRARRGVRMVRLQRPVAPRATSKRSACSIPDSSSTTRTSTSPGGGEHSGWRYPYVPSSVARHVHAASSVEDSPFFVYQVERNRLHRAREERPGRYAWRAFLGSVVPTARFAVRDVMLPVLHLRRPHPRLVTLQAARRSGHFALQLPGVLRDRHGSRKRQTVPDAELMAWLTTR